MHEGEVDKNITVDDLREIEMEILDHIDRVCKKHKIRYYLEAGTALGAVRHKGYIPWDDDLDIIVPRRDYRRLLKVLSKESDRYKVLSMYDQPDYFYLFAKVIDGNTRLIERGLPEIKDLGVYVDIFPLDGVPSGKLLNKLYFDIFTGLRTAVVLSVEKDTEVKDLYGRFLKALSKILGRRVLMKLADGFCFINSVFCHKRFADIAGYEEWTRYKTTSRDAFRRRIRVPFEDRHYYIPEGYDELLTTEFGDYMTPPPEEDRVSGHDFEAYRIK